MNNEYLCSLPREPLNKNQHEEEAKSIQAVQGSIVRYDSDNKQITELFTTGLRNCVGIVLIGKNKVSLVHADVRTRIKDIENEISWIGAIEKATVYCNEIWLTQDTRRKPVIEMETLKEIPSIKWETQGTKDHGSITVKINESNQVDVKDDKTNSYTDKSNLAKTVLLINFFFGEKGLYIFFDSKDFNYPSLTDEATIFVSDYNEDRISKKSTWPYIAGKYPNFSEYLKSDLDIKKAGGLKIVSFKFIMEKASLENYIKCYNSLMSKKPEKLLQSRSVFASIQQRTPNAKDEDVNVEGGDRSRTLSP